VTTGGYFSGDFAEMKLHGFVSRARGTKAAPVSSSGQRIRSLMTNRGGAVLAFALMMGALH
jgi:hypothetical protein